MMTRIIMTILGKRTRKRTTSIITIIIVIIISSSLSSSSSSFILKYKPNGNYVASYGHEGKVMI